MKKYIIISLALIATVATVSVYKFTDFKHTEPQVVQMNMEWPDSIQNIKDAYNTSDLIVTGTVKNERTELINNLPFTYYTIDVEKNVKGSKLKNIEVRVTGGMVNNITYKSDREIPLVVNKNYTLMVRKTYPDDTKSNVYTLTGGYQGAFELDNNKKIKAFNASNNLEKVVINKNIEEALDK